MELQPSLRGRGQPMVRSRWVTEGGGDGSASPAGRGLGWTTPFDRGWGPHCVGVRKRLVARWFKCT